MIDSGQLSRCGVGGIAIFTMVENFYRNDRFSGLGRGGGLCLPRLVGQLELTRAMSL